MIEHAIPKHPYFAIIQPWSGPGYSKFIEENKGKKFELKDPNTGQVNKGIFVDKWIYKLSEFEGSDGFSMICFGQPAQKIISHLKLKFPELQAKESKLEIWLMKRV